MTLPPDRLAGLDPATGRTGAAGGGDALAPVFPTHPPVWRLVAALTATAACAAALPVVVHQVGPWAFAAAPVWLVLLVLVSC
jgi:hypothetical protein